ncbi:MAG: NAD-glutamate dehydrogenase [Hellea sp.]|nr:NAD-glutamate dehydrogenase [Hellea sp.]
MAELQFTEDAFLKAAAKLKDFTNLSDDGFEAGAEGFLKDFYRDASESDFASYEIAELVDLARAFWMFPNRRKVGELLFNIDTISNFAPKCAPRQDSVIVMAFDDMSFLVDSIVAAISSFGVNVTGLFHPVVTGSRDEEGKWVQGGATEIDESLILVTTSTLGKKAARDITAELKRTLEEVRIINQDFKALITDVQRVCEDLRSLPNAEKNDDIQDGIEFLEWIAAGNFVLLGARSYDFTKSATKNGKTPDFANPVVDKKGQLGLLRNSDVTVLRQSSEPSVIDGNVAHFMQSSPTVTVAKSNIFTRVHRRVRMDYISVKQYDWAGDVIGETRYVGLFTSDAYSLAPQQVPLIRQKVSRVLERASLGSGSHNRKRLDYVLSTFPRDELFQIEEDELLRIATGVAQGFDRPRTRIFVRRDPFDRFASVLVYVPLEHYNTRVRMRIGDELKEAFGGRISAFYPQYSDAPMARVHFIIGMNPDEGLKPDLTELEARIAEIAQPWFDRVIYSTENLPDEVEVDVSNYADAFSVAYQNAYSPEDAVRDIQMSETLSETNTVAIDVYDKPGKGEVQFRAKLYSLDKRIEPSNVMPVFDNFASHIVQETGYELVRETGKPVWVHDFEIRISHEAEDGERLAQVFEKAFLATWNGQNEDDRFNRLILPLSANWRNIALLRLIARYRRQSGMDPSEATQIEALSQYPELTGQIIEYLKVKFDPSLFEKITERKKAAAKIMSEIQIGLNAVKALDHDRVIRRIADAAEKSLRTNFYQTDEDGNFKPYISVKFNSQAIDDLPAPKPYREIYVSSPRVEAVHLRFGPVARGGLRWSDRRDDFRTEVLGLVKAQQVKNAVIVPVGSKGGFFPKQLPTSGTRDEWLAEGIAAYKTFISGILDITDTYKGEGTVPPEDVISWDAPDPYLVVAADKGTATFSDIANGISQDYGFWLDDAFASGGSAGYDHKVMGITARGAWEAVKRHFREMGKDIQSEDFSVIGVGDMSGDVFGNGMLLSKHIKLLAAFNHLHIFIDPDPDTAKSFKERARMFKLPRSTWDDYNKKLISKGGGIFARSDKSIELTPEIKEMTGLTKDEVTPDELLHALLKSETELLWFGGIGTYVKATSESHAEVGDKANDNLRVNGAQLKAKVIGEGANLGMTQAGRIEFARKGGRLNTDAIDNSAGVDSSDNEVNIKILLRGAIERKALAAKNRNQLLVDMTDNVGELVLQHNYDQTGALSLAEMRAPLDHNAYERFMTSLERRNLLNRAVEGLPSKEAMQALAAEKKGLTRPEISVILAYSKIVLFDDLIDTDVADDPYMEKILADYFPEKLQKFKKAMGSHRLRREIITSRLVNKIVDVCGPLAVMRQKEQTQGSVDAIAKAFVVAYETLNVAELREEIAKLDNKLSAKAQTELHQEIARVLMRVIAWLVRRNESGSIEKRIARRDKLVSLVDNRWLALLSPYDHRRAEGRIKAFKKSGISKELATDVALLRSRASGFDVLELSNAIGWDMPDSAELFYEIGGRFKIDRIRAALLSTDSSDHWERLAMRHLQEDFFKAQFQFARSAAKYHKKNGDQKSKNIDTLIADWVRERVPNIKAYEETVSAMSRKGGWTVPKFAIVNAQLSDLMVGL